MKLWKLGPIQGSTLLIVAGLALVVIGAGGLISNSLQVPTDVSDTPVSLAQTVVLTEGIGGESEHLALSASVTRGVTYDTGVEIVSIADAGNAELRVVVAKLGISVGDVSVRYFDGAVWQDTTMIDQGDTLMGALPDVVVTNGYYSIVMFLITFNLAGHYDTIFAMYTV